MPDLELNSESAMDELPATTEDGFLRDPANWNEAVALRLARREAIDLTEEHWEILRFLRDYQQRYQHLPTPRMFVKAVQKALGDHKGNSRYLHGLFPDQALKRACRIAGLAKPPGCL